MPVLQIPSGHNWPSALDVATVLAVMAYPDNAGARAEFLRPVQRLERVSELSERLGSLRFPTEVAAIHRELEEIGLESNAERIQRDFKAALAVGLSRGLIVGLRLIYLRHTAAVIPGLSTVQQSHKVVEKAVLEIGYPASKSTIKSAWQSHRSVSHWWAAYAQSRTYLREGGNNAAYCNLFSEQGLPGFVALAESYRRFGENKTMRDGSRRVSVLPAGSTWRVPSELALPSVEIREEVSFIDGPTITFVLGE